MDIAGGDWLDYLDRFQRLPRRIVSLVPSLTESIFDLGCGESLVGVTDYCRYPEAGVAALPHLGGTKTPRVQDIISLEPDLVIANREENEKQTIMELIAADLPVWVTYPQTVEEALAALYALARLFRRPSATQRIKTLETAVEWTRAASIDTPGFSYFCPVWQEQTADGGHWWMTFNGHTYANSVLSLFGGRNIFAARARRYPLEADLAVEPGHMVEDPGDRDTRYPRISLAEIQATDPEVILLPNEPFSFSSRDRDEIALALAGSSAVALKRIYALDGSLISWHGTRLARTLQTLPGLIAKI